MRGGLLYEIFKYMIGVSHSDDAGIVHQGENATITDNIFYRPCIKEKKNPAFMLQNITEKIVSDRNVFFSPYKHHPAGGRLRASGEKDILLSQGLSHWQKATGCDRNSIAADPLFVDVEKGDFRLKENSPAKGKGALEK